MVYGIIFWLFLSVMGGVIASQKGRSGFGFFFLSILFSPLIGIIAALVARPNIGKIENEMIEGGRSKKCPYCAEIVRHEAIVCKHCGRDLPIQKEEGAAPPFQAIIPNIKIIEGKKMIEFNCPLFGEVIHIKNSYSGIVEYCPECSGQVMVPEVR
jgi:hypothetical protein